MACKRRPRNHTQLDNGKATAAYDCGVEKTRDAIDFASCGKVDVDETKLRDLMGKPGKQATNPPDWKRAIESDFVAAKFKSKGLRAPRARLLDGVEIELARADLDSGRFLIGAGWYGTLNERAPRKSGSRTFGDNHAFGIFGRVANDRTNENDPLCDGRPSPGGGRYPEGTQRILWSVLREIFGDVRLRTRNSAGKILTERKLGRGKFLGVSVARSKPLDDGESVPEPEPNPVVDWPAELAALESDLADVLSDLGEARTDLDRSEESIATIRRHIADLAREIDAQSGGTGT